MSASFAAPSTGGAATRTTSAPPRSPANSVLLARGMTRTVRIIDPGGRAGATGRRGGQRGEVAGSGRAPDPSRLSCPSALLLTLHHLQKHLVLVLAGILLADVLERVAERLDGGFDRVLDFFPLELEAIDLALDVLETRLGAVHEERRAALGLADDPLRFLLGVRLNLV